MIAFYGICTLKVIPALQKYLMDYLVLIQTGADSIEKELLETKNSPKKNFSNYDERTKLDFKSRLI